MYNRIASIKNSQKSQTRLFHNFYFKKEATPHTHQYAAHSPLQISKNKTDQLRSKIFFEHPPIPHRVAKFFLGYCILACFYAGVNDKIKRKNKVWARQQDKKIFRQIMPFVQAMENLRYTALDQKNYMYLKAVSDNAGPNVLENVRWRFHQEDIFVPETLGWQRSHLKTTYNNGVFNFVKGTTSATEYDRGLLDAREVGYIY